MNPVSPLANLDPDNDMILACVPTDLVVEIAAGRFDVRRLAQLELAARGFDATGRWVGFNRAEAVHQVNSGAPVRPAIEPRPEPA